LVISRVFPAPRSLVFKAWSSAEHMRRWFSPEGCTVPHAEIDFRPGGVCIICMRLPDGQDFWTKGQYLEITPPERLVFTANLVVSDERKFTALTTVTFEDHGHGTRMTVRQDYEIHDESFLFAVKGAPEGWRTTLNKLEREVASLQIPEARPAAHATFSIQRTYTASPAQVFHALTDPRAKARWFGGGEGYTPLRGEMDVRPGGREHVSGRWSSGVVSAFDAIYFDVVPDTRLVYASELHLNERKISVSLATLELTRQGDGTRLVLTEQGAFLDGYDDAGAREQGTRALLEKLAASLAG
jgi:uncharacterized protein YndB with AHSA1/START domain